MNVKSPIDLYEVLWGFRRRVWVLLLPPVTTVCAAILVISVTVPLYESGVTVALVEEPTVSDALEPLVGFAPGRRRDNYGVAAAKLDNTIHSRPFLAGVARRVGFASDPGFLQEGVTVARQKRGITAEEYALRKAINLIRDKIVVDRIGIPFVRVKVVDTDPAIAQRIAAVVGDVLIEDSRRIGLERTDARQQFSSEQVSLYERKLQESEDALRNFTEAMIERETGQSLVNSANREIARAALHSVTEETAQLQERARIDEMDWSGSGHGAEQPMVRGPVALELESLLGELEVGHAGALLRGTVGSEDATALKAKIGDARQRLFTELQSLANQQDGELDVHARSLLAGIWLDRAILRSLNRKRTHLDTLIQKHVEHLRSSPGDQMRVERLRSDVQINRDILLALRKEASSSEISGAMESSKLSVALDVVEAAQLPLAPSWPEPRKLLAGALLVGLVLSAGWVALADRIGGTVSSVQDVMRVTGRPVVGTMPRVEGWAPPGGIIRRHWALVSIVLIVVMTVGFVATQGCESMVMPPRTEQASASQP